MFFERVMKLFIGSRAILHEASKIMVHVMMIPISLSVWVWF